MLASRATITATAPSVRAGVEAHDVGRAERVGVSDWNSAPDMPDAAPTAAAVERSRQAQLLDHVAGDRICPAGEAASTRAGLMAMSPTTSVHASATSRAPAAADAHLPGTQSFLTPAPPPQAIGSIDQQDDAHPPAQPGSADDDDEHTRAADDRRHDPDLDLRSVDRPSARARRRPSPHRTEQRCERHRAPWIRSEQHPRRVGAATSPTKSTGRSAAVAALASSVIARPVTTYVVATPAPSERAASSPSSMAASRRVSPSASTIPTTT